MNPKILFLFIAIIQMTVACRNSKHTSTHDINLIQDTTASKVPDSSILLDKSKDKKLLEDCAGSKLMEKVDTFWTPNEREYQDLELNLFKLNNQIKDLNKYIIQYVGIIFNGSKYIYINAFDKRDLNEAKRIYLDLTSASVVPCGGGKYYWRVLYDVNLKDFMEAQFNAPK
jgi:hypothetical protein